MKYPPYRMIIEDHHEHLKCQYYDNVEFPLIKIHKLTQESLTSRTMRNNLLVFVLAGNVDYNIGNDRHQKAVKGDFMLIPQGSSVDINDGTDCIIMAFRLLQRVSFCECYMIEQLFDEYSEKAAESSNDKEITCNQIGSDENSPWLHYAPLPKIQVPVWNFLWSLYSSISDGLLCRNYFDIKIKELFYLLRSYYSKEELYELFHPVASPDTLFSDYVMINHRKYKTVAQLAASMSMSHSGFARKFSKIFHRSPYQWMIEQKSEAIYSELAHGSMNLKQVAAHFDFLSPTQFNDFCKEKWGRTPGEIRKNPYKKQYPESQAQNSEYIG